MDEKDEYITFLENTIRNIADIIYMEMPLRVQDEWLNSVIQDELYTPEEDLWKQASHLLSYLPLMKLNIWMKQ